MKISIKDIICDIKTINNVLYISDADCNRVLYPKTRSASRGKRMGKNKLADLDRDKMVKINGIMFYPLETKHIDDCYHNQILVG
jgi:hypothetical protein